ncbi:hypothetical protein [Acinetobacter haemolyticus]|uniref:hypothetical protein n=1 Tax=Acinetobacter haemolyticus TaxID=29430 RepID=UPI003F57334C
MILLYFTFALFFFLLYYFFDRKKSGDFILIGLFLTIFHFLFGYFNVLNSMEKVVDSVNYYNWGTTAAINYFEFSIGSSFIVHLVNWLSAIFSSFEQMSVFFTGMSLLAFLKLLSLAYSEYYKGNVRHLDFFVILCFLFLPGFHYWTVAIGKDSLIFVAIFMAFYGFYKRNILYIFLGCILMFFVRVHIFAIFILSLVFSEYFFAYLNFLNLKKKIYKFLLLSLSIPLSFGLFIFLFNYIQKYSADGFSDIDSFLDGRAEVYADLGSGAWLSVQPYPIKLFAFVFGGVPWISLDMLTIASMVEGAILFLMVAYVIYHLRRGFYNYNIRDKAIVFSILFFVFSLVLFFSLINNNLGVMVRMKVMIYSPLLMLFIIVLSNRNRRC